jgi:hypothetical protein
MVWSNWWYLVPFEPHRDFLIPKGLAWEQLWQLRNSKTEPEDHIETATLPPLLWLSDHRMTKNVRSQK